MLQNARVTGFTVSELLRKNQQGEGGKFTPHTPTQIRKSVQTRSFFWSVFSCIQTKYEPEKTPYLDTFHAVRVKHVFFINRSLLSYYQTNLMMIGCDVFLLFGLPILWEWSGAVFDIFKSISLLRTTRTILSVSSPLVSSMPWISKQFLRECCC